MATTPDEVRQLGKLIHETRINKKISRLELARRSAVPRTTLIRLEKGTIARPRLDLVSAIAVALEVPASEYFAVLGWQADTTLPGLVPYLRARYSQLPPETLAEIQAYLQTIAERDGIDFDQPPTRLIG